MKRYGWLFLGLWCALTSMGQTGAQDSVRAAFSAERGTLLVGEPVELVLTVAVNEGVQAALPTIPSDWPPFQVLWAGEVSQESGGGGVAYRQRFRVTLWQTGDFVTPETWIQYRLPGASEPSSVRVQPAYFTVPSVLNEDDLLPRPYTPPLSRLFVPAWAIAAAAALVSLGGTLGVRNYLRLRAQGEKRDQTPISAGETALLELRRLTGEGLQPEQTVIRSGTCLRQFVEVEFGVPASEMTTQELVAALERGSVLPSGGLQALQGLLERIDLVKFAGLRCERPTALQIVRAASDWVVSVNEKRRRNLE